MNKKSIIVSALMLCTGVAVGLGMPSEKAKAPAAQDTHSMGDDPMMAAWEAFATPGAEHTQLAKRAGKWNGAVKHWMDPTQPPHESVCTSEAKMIMGGRYLAEHVSGDFGGMPFEGMGVTGYDNIQKKYVFTWIDNMGTGIMNGEGTWNASKKMMSSTSTMSCPMVGGVTTCRGAETWIDDNTMKMEMFNKGPDGKEFKSMEITYTRAK